MKYLKRALKIIFGLLLVLAIVALIFIIVDKNNTSYLNINNIPNSSKNSYLITNINIVPMSNDTILSNKTLFIKAGIIEKIDDSISIEGVEIIDGQNKYLSPGLIDMHTHLWDKQELGLYLANGVTTVRNLWGYSMHLRIKENLDNDKIIGPMFFSSSPKLTSPHDLGDDKVQVNTPEEAKKLVIEYKKRGFDFIKIYAGLKDDLYQAILKQSKASGISIVAHPSREIPYLNQFHSQIASIEHSEEIVQQALDYQLDSLKVEPVIQKFVSTNMSFCPTLTGYYKIFEMLEKGESILKTEPVHYINPLIQKVDSKVQYNRWANEKINNSSVTKNIYQQHQFHLYVLKKMHEEGVNIVCGTDAGIGITAPGYSIHQELAFYKDAGMSNFEALKTATINPTKTHKEFAQMGTIEIGKLANLIVTPNNPLKNLNVLSKPDWVMVKGRKINKTTLNEFVDNAKDRSNLLVTAFRYAEYMLVEK
ncbi:amidohydrolase family protein [Flaviramulus aquimarinus]|uniref:Amidohydrolase family protein n=1 Tax=Flaviramulus aquimarinus TaxID=1170456 RepID=A0ABP9FAV7_9FLAO